MDDNCSALNEAPAALTALASPGSSFGEGVTGDLSYFDWISVAWESSGNRLCSVPVCVCSSLAVGPAVGGDIAAGMGAGIGSVHPMTTSSDIPPVEPPAGSGTGEGVTYTRAELCPADCGVRHGPVVMTKALSRCWVRYSAC